MTTTDIANSALALLGELAITSIDDTASPQARLCKQFVAGAVAETLRLGRWNCATKRATLNRLADPPPDGSFDYYYQLPNDCLRVMEINGEEFCDSTEYYEVEGQRLACNDSSVALRYISGATVTLDPLLANAVAMRLAYKIAVPLSGSTEKSAFMLQMFGKALAEARQVDAQESGSRENSGWDRVLGRSRLLNGRRVTRDPLRIEKT